MQFLLNFIYLTLKIGIYIILFDDHLKSKLLGKRLELPLPTTPGPLFLPRGPHLVLLALGKMFQNLSVSSPAPVTIELPSGFMAR